MADQKTVQLGDPVIFVYGITGRGCAGIVTELFGNGTVGLLVARDEYPYVQFSVRQAPYSLIPKPDTFHFQDDIDTGQSTDLIPPDPGTPIQQNVSQSAVQPPLTEKPQVKQEENK